MNPLGNLPDQIDQLGESQYPNIYGGVVAIDSASRLDVYLTVLDPSAEEAIEAISPPGVITFVQTPNSLATINAVAAEMDSDVAQLTQDGVDVNFWAPQPQTGTVDVEVVNLTPDDTQTLNDLLGSQYLTIESVSGPGVSLSRDSDSAPWNAGDNINDGEGACSSGFAINYDGYTASLTASHCYSVGASVDNQIVTPGGLGGNTATVGTIVAQQDTTGSTDTEVIQTTGGSSDLIWTGAIGSAVRSTVSGETTNPIGYQVCADGAYSGEVCGLTISSNAGRENGLYETPTGEIEVVYYNQVTAADPGVAVAGDGDSGGPVFRF